MKKRGSYLPSSQFSPILSDGEKFIMNEEDRLDEIIA